MAKRSDHKTGLTVERLKRSYDFFPEDGRIIWKLVTRKTHLAGKNAGTLHSLGYVQVAVDKGLYKAHRLMWFYVYGKWPKELDHINRNKSDNRIVNLREVTHSQNSANTGIRKNNTSGLTGVRFRADRKKWVARSTDNGKMLHLGHFATAESAFSAYRKHAKQKYGQYCPL